jgi:hypothetical protein
VIVHCPGCNKDFHLNVSDPKTWLAMYRDRTSNGVPVFPCHECWATSHVQQTPAPSSATVPR